MAVSVYKTFAAGEVLSAADLNASLTQFTNNGTDVAFPLTKAVSAGDFAVTALGNATTDTGAANLRNIAILNKSVCDFRLSLTTAVPVTTTDVTAAETLYMVPFDGNCIGLYDGTRWHIRETAEISIDVPDATGVYDVFVYDNAGTATLELTAWTNDTTRATALTTQDGILSKTGALTRRYLGTFYCTTAGNGQTVDSVGSRYLWNYYNRVPRPISAGGSSLTWNYTTNTARQADASSANQVNFVIGVQEDVVEAYVKCWVKNSSANVAVGIGLGLDATNSLFVTAPPSRSDDANTLVAGVIQPMMASFNGYVAVGKHYLSWNEVSAATGTTSWYWSSPTSSAVGGIFGTIWG